MARRPVFWALVSVSVPVLVSAMVSALVSVSISNVDPLYGNLYDPVKKPL